MNMFSYFLETNSAVGSFTYYTRQCLRAIFIFYTDMRIHVQRTFAEKLHQGTLGSTLKR